MKRGPDNNLTDERPSKRRHTDLSYQFSYGSALTADERIVALPGSVRIYYQINGGLAYKVKHPSGIYYAKDINIELAKQRDLSYASCFRMSSEIFDQFITREEKIAVEQYVTSELQAIEQYAPIAICAKPKTHTTGIEAIKSFDNALAKLIEHEYYLQLISENKDYEKLYNLLNELEMLINSDFMTIHEDTDDLLVMYHRVNYIFDNIPYSLEDAFLPFSVDFLTTEEHPYITPLGTPYKFKFPNLLKQVDAGNFSIQETELTTEESEEPILNASNENIICDLPLELLSYILSFLTISKIEEVAQVNKWFKESAYNQSIWHEKAIDYGMAIEEHEPNFRQKLKKYLVEISKKFPTPLIQAIGPSKFFDYPRLRDLSSTDITLELMQGNEIMWGIFPTDFHSCPEYPFVSLCLKNKFSGAPCSVTLGFGITDPSDNTKDIYGIPDFLPHGMANCANALTWDFIGRLSRHEPCGLPKYVKCNYQGEGNRTLPDGRSVLELTDQSPSAIVRRL